MPGEEERGLGIGQDALQFPSQEKLTGRWNPRLFSLPT
jgi:hypothetical protein